MIVGVDVSSWQAEEFQLELDGAPVDFAIIKATQGLGYLNPKLLGQLRHARANGLSVGFYHFADAGDIDKQADAFLQAIRPVLRLGDHLWFDWEKTDISSDQKDQWIRRVQQAEPEHKVGLYCNREYWLNRDTSSFAGDALWIANHNNQPGVPNIEAPWVIHQYSADGGIDHNTAQFTSRADMKAWAGEPVTGGDSSAVLAALAVITQGVADLLAGQNRIEEKIDQLGRQVANIPAGETTDQLRELKTAVGKVQSTAIGLPKKVADEINKRLTS